MPDPNRTSHTAEPEQLPESVVDAPLTVEALSAAVEVADTALRRLGKHIEQASARHEAEMAETRQRLDAMQSLSPAARLNELSNASATAHRALVAATDTQRVEQLRILHAVERRIAAVDALFASPIQLLARAKLGDPVRSEYQRQLAGAGPAALRSMAALAIATRDRALGAAVLAAVDRVPVGGRAFSAQELAEKLVGDEWRAARTAIDTVKQRRQAASLANRAWERNQPNRHTRIRDGLAQRAAADNASQ